jgi:3-oxoacyl-[acyl-carrier-protein] synthase II
MNRVLITGMGVVSPLGNTVDQLMEGLKCGRSAVCFMEEWSRYCGMNSHVAAPAELKDEKKIPRQKRRSMGRMSIFAAQAAEQACADAGLEESLLGSATTGCIIGSTTGSAISISRAFETMLFEKDLTLLPSSMFFQCMSHTAAINVAQYLGLRGHVMATSAACASSLQAIGAGYDLIRSGRQTVLLCGGAEELHPSVTGTFDVVFAASSHFNDAPHQTPRPFDSRRDGLVCGEGSGIVVLEEYEHAVRRGAPVYAELIGYSTCGSGSHISQSEEDSIVQCISETLADAGLNAGQIDYVNAHATGTLQGDREEAAALRSIFADSVPVSSLKGYLGHTLGASGAIELIASLMMMGSGTIYPTLNLEEAADDCSGIGHVLQPVGREMRYLMKNCFAFGGINASLICRNPDFLS